MTDRFFNLSTHDAARFNDVTGVYTFDAANFDITLLGNTKLIPTSVSFNTTYVNVTSQTNVVALNFHTMGVGIYVTIPVLATASYTNASLVSAFNTAVSTAIGLNATLSAPTAATCTMAYSSGKFTITSNKAFTISSAGTTFPLSLIGFRQLQDTAFAASSTQYGMKVATIETITPFYIVITTRTAPSVSNLTGLLTTQGNAAVSIVVPNHGIRNTTTGMCTVSLIEEMANAEKFLPRTATFYMAIYDSRTFKPMEFVDAVNIVFKAIR